MGMFQATKATKEETRKMLATINLSLGVAPLREERLDEVFEAMWPNLETTIKSLTRVEKGKVVKRSLDEMVAEILQIVRAEANRNTTQTPSPQIAFSVAGLTTSQVDAIMLAVSREYRFLASLLEPACRWEFEGDSLRVIFRAKDRPLAEMLQSREQIAKLQRKAKEVLGGNIRVSVALEPNQ
jgi:hypothetical protein